MFLDWTLTSMLTSESFEHCYIFMMKEFAQGNQTNELRDQNNAVFLYKPHAAYLKDFFVWQISDNEDSLASCCPPGISYRLMVLSTDTADLKSESVWTEWTEGVCRVSHMTGHFKDQQCMTFCSLLKTLMSLYLCFCRGFITVYLHQSASDL